jgi:glycosyltransferase involved in cell wall biosynthesis
MLTSSYPRFEGDGVGTFVEPIAHGVAALGHEVHIVAPWHPLLDRPDREGGVRFHFFRYAPFKRLHRFGYATSLRADVALRPAAYLVTPFAVGAWWRAVRKVVRAIGTPILHAHWVVPGGLIAALSRGRAPLVISLHGSDVFLAEANPLARAAARFTFAQAGWVTACSDDLRRRSIDLGANADTTEIVPYGVDTNRFKPDPLARRALGRSIAANQPDPIVLAVGRLVRKKGFEFLLEAMARLSDRWPQLSLALAGSGDLDEELRHRAGELGIARRVTFLGAVPQQQIPTWLAAATIVVVPSVRDEAGNVDGLPNTLLEALASGTPVVTTAAGGIGSVVVDGHTGSVVPERDPEALAQAIEHLLTRPAAAARLGQAARAEMCRSYTWDRVAHRFEQAYARVEATLGS